MLRRTWKATKIILLSLLGLILILVAGAASYRAIRQHQNATAMAIHTPNGIDEAMFVPIGGINQWITIRGRNRDSPAVLFVHGGPGTPNSPLNAFFAPYEKAFVVVQWDQRGAGRTYSRSGPIGERASIDLMAQDGIEVCEYVRRHLHRQKIILIGHSWGSVLGIRMAKARPDLFVAYIGTGQIVSPEDSAVGYSQILAKARAKNDTAAVQALLAAPPPFADANKFSAFETVALNYEVRANPMLNDLLPELLTSPDYDLKDVWAWMRLGRASSMMHFFGARMDGPLASNDIRRLGLHFDTPIFVFQGAQDDITPATVAEAWLDTLSAPNKTFALIAGGGHVALFSHSDTFIRLIEQYASPLATEPKDR